MDNNRDRRESPSWLTTGAIGLAAAAAIGGAAYLFSSKKEPQQQSAPKPSPKPKPAAAPQLSRNSNIGARSTMTSDSSYLYDMVSRMVLSNCTVTPERRSPVIPDNPVITNLNSLLSDIIVRYITLKEFDLHYKVFDTIFQQLHKNMKDVDAYYNKYSSTVQFAGSHYDNLRIRKPDEFDMDIVIGLPLNIKPDPSNPTESDIVIEAKAPGFVQLRMGVQFQRLPMRDRDEWQKNKAAYEWKDNSNYLLRSNFIAWFKGVVIRGLNKFEVRSGSRPLVYVEGVPYIIDVSESGPAMTLKIHNRSRGFQLDVDLVPALKFPENRWPISKSYRAIPQECKKDYWMVVPKPNKDSPISHDQNRSWRIALHNQERELMYDCYNLKPTIRLTKKLRDSLGMNKIASYYIKTVFFWEIVERNDKLFWRNSYDTLFKHMVKKLHKALVDERIPYFWNKDNNLIGGVPKNILKSYANKLESLIAVLEDPSKYKLVAKYLLTAEEFVDYNARFLHI